MKKISQDQIKKELYYNRATGQFVRIKNNKNAGTTLKNSYIAIYINRKLYYAHRLAWIYINGNNPEQIDHINHIRNDNRISNLRSINSTQNSQNTKLYKNNKSGRIGVCWDKKNSKWEANIRVGRKLFLGYYDDINEAINARCHAERIYRFHTNHGGRNV